MEWTAAILAGGHASRYGGCDKGQLIVDGRTILDRQLAELRAAHEILMVGGGNSTAGVRIVPDTLPGQGPLGGLHTALSESACGVTVVVACDMPYVSADFLNYLASLAGEADAAVPVTERGYHPLCAAYTRACLEPVTRRLRSGQLKMTDALGDLRVRVVSAGEIERFGRRQHLLANINTPADHRGLAALQSHEL